MESARLRTRTNSEGQVKYCRCTFFGHATPDRAGARPYRVECRVARCGMGLPAHTSHPLSRLFACFAGPIPRKSGVVTEAQFLIGLRVLCGLLCICSSSTRVPVDDGFPEAKRDASPTLTSRTLRACHSNLQARRHRGLCGRGSAALLPSVKFSLFSFCPGSHCSVRSFFLICLPLRPR